MRLPSLASRLIASSTLLLPVFLGTTGYALNLAFEDSLETAESERLQSQVYLLLGAAEMEGEQLVLPDALTEPRYSQINSGLFAELSKADGERIWLSESGRLQADALTDISNINFNAERKAPLAGQTQFLTLGLDKLPFFVFYHDVLWETESGVDALFRIAIYHQQSSFLAERRAYRNQLWRWLGTAGIAMIFLQWLILRWGLKPLKRLASDLKAIETGHEEQLLGDYPNEVQHVTDNLNAVLEREQRQRDRYRNSLNDLAHSLKTPLAVLRSSLSTSNEELREQVDSQVVRMDEIIGRQLQRAITRNLAPKRELVDIESNALRISTALTKVYRDKTIAYSSDIAPGCGFNGDESDLMEVLGNVLENAFKYGQSQVHLEGKVVNKHLCLSVGDDGPGVDPSLHEAILQRGARADTAQTGQGIGLSMVVEIVSSYGGSLSLGKSVLGGAEFTLKFPT